MCVRRKKLVSLPRAMQTAGCSPRQWAIQVVPALATPIPLKSSLKSPFSPSLASAGRIVVS